MFVGTNLVAIAVASGLWAVIAGVPEVRTVLVWASIAYFVWLALKIAFAGARIGFIESERAPGFVNGMLLQLINPKAYAVNNLLFSGYAFWPDSLLVEVILKLVLTNLVWIPVHLIWLGAGVRVRRLDLPARVQRAINVAMALSLMIVVALAAVELA